MGMETKTHLNQDTMSTLQSLIQVNLDSRDGFREAADEVQEVNLSSYFRQCSEDRAAQANELQQFILVNAEEPQRTGSVAAAAHRTWMNIRNALGGGSSAVLSEAERGEDYIKSKYENALKDLAGSAVSDILNRQYRAIKQTHDAVRDMRDTYKADTQG